MKLTGVTCWLTTSTTDVVNRMAKQVEVMRLDRVDVSHMLAETFSNRSLCFPDIQFTTLNENYEIMLLVEVQEKYSLTTTVLTRHIKSAIPDKRGQEIQWGLSQGNVPEISTGWS